jgi:hypothetical protein
MTRFWSRTILGLSPSESEQGTHVITAGRKNGYADSLREDPQWQQLQPRRFNLS